MRYETSDLNALRRVSDGRGRKAAPVPAGRGIHPILRQLFHIVEKEHLSLGKIEILAGTGKDSLTKLKHGKKRPFLDDVTAFADVLGFRVSLHKKHRRRK